MSGICARGLMLMFKKFGILVALSELLEPHLFGKPGALKFGTTGVHHLVVLTRLADSLPQIYYSYSYMADCVAAWL